jgi:hypothetical protein
MKISKRTHYRQHGVAWQENSKSKDKAPYVLRKKVRSTPALVETFEFPINFPSGVLLSLLFSQTA